MVKFLFPEILSLFVFVLELARAMDFCPPIQKRKLLFEELPDFTIQKILNTFDDPTSFENLRKLFDFGKYALIRENDRAIILLPPNSYKALSETKNGGFTRLEDADKYDVLQNFTSLFKDVYSKEFRSHYKLLMDTMERFPISEEFGNVTKKHLSATWNKWMRVQMNIIERRKKLETYLDYR
ncbi:hypothetical protein ACOME3_007858 [Neoechinorhynchus agilis]